MKPLCMKHWDRPRTDCDMCQLQKRVQEAIRRGVRQDRIEKYLADKVASDIEKLNAKVQEAGL